jgi:hypothetical protein
MAANSPERLELRNRQYALPKRQQRWLSATMWILPTLPVVAIAVLLALHASGAIDGREAADKFTQGLARDPWGAAAAFLAFVLPALQIGYMRLASRNERLVLTEFEIRYESPLPPTLRFLQPSWGLRWSELSGARLAKSSLINGPLSAVLELETVYGKRQLRPYQWIDPQTYVAPNPWKLMRQASSLRGLQLEEAVAESALMKFVAGRVPRIKLVAGWASAAAPFALEKNPRALALVGLFVALVIYGIVDSYVDSETYAASPPYFFFSAIGALGGGLAWIWLRAGEVPSMERSVVAVFLAVALGAALYPGLLRANRWTDTVGLRTYRYTLEADLTLIPTQDGPPALRFGRDLEYWMQFRPGSTHEFRLRRGALGFFQLDMAPVHEALREYYWKNK